MKHTNRLYLATLAALSLSACAPARSNQSFMSAAETPKASLQNDNHFTVNLPIAAPAADRVAGSGSGSSAGASGGAGAGASGDSHSGDGGEIVVTAPRKQAPAPAAANPAPTKPAPAPAKPNAPAAPVATKPAPAKPAPSTQAPVAAKPAPAKPAPAPAHVTVLPPTKLPIPAWAGRAQSEAWTRITIRALKELGTDMIKTDLLDARDFCPAYNRLKEEDRQKVWVQLISSMAKYESDLNPLSTYTESFKGDDQKFVVSRGLLQISKGSANLYGCNITKETQLENSETNLRCGVRILNTLVTKYKAIHGHQQLDNANLIRNPWRGAARYWSVLRGKVKDLLIRSSVHQMVVCHS